MKDRLCILIFLRAWRRKEHTRSKKMRENSLTSSSVDWNLCTFCVQVLFVTCILSKLFCRVVEAFTREGEGIRSILVVCGPFMSSHLYGSLKEVLLARGNGLNCEKRREDRVEQFHVSSSRPWLDFFDQGQRKECRESCQNVVTSNKS